MIKSAHEVYPEALAPLLGGIQLERTISEARTSTQRLREAQANLFELAANSSSMYPNVPSLARYLEARTQFMLATNASPLDNDAKQACIRTVEKACVAGGLPEVALSDYFDFAIGLKQIDLAHLVLINWEQLNPGSPKLKLARVNLNGLELREKSRQGN